MSLFDFRSTSINKAFILNAISISLIALASVEFNRFLFKNNNLCGHPFCRYILAFLASFLAAITIFWLMYLFLGYGGGMLGPKEPLNSPFKNVDEVDKVEL